jgi:iron(III) transport system substrate-binding protein
MVKYRSGGIRPAPWRGAGSAVRLVPWVLALAIASAGPAAYAAMATCGKTAQSDKIWKDMIAAAQKEGVLSVAASGQRNYTPVYNHFSKKFGIKVVISYGGGRQHATRILAERSGGIYAVDVGHVGGNTVNRRLIPNGAVAPIADYLVAPQVTNTSCWYGQQLWFVDKQQKHSFVHSADFTTAVNMFINTKSVTDVDLAALKSPDDLFKDRWKKKIVALSPMEGQSGNSYFRYGVLPTMGPRWMKRFVQDGYVEFQSRSKLIEDGLARGKYHLAIFPYARPLAKMEKQGLPVKQIWHEFEGADGIMTAGSTAQAVQVYDRAPHPNAAKLFVNWLASQDGQTFIHDNLKGGGDPRNSLRVDVPKTNVDPETLPKKGVKYFPIDLQPKYQGQRKAIMKQIQDWYKEKYK